jgi:hypothetical protein
MWNTQSHSNGRKAVEEGYWIWLGEARKKSLLEQKEQAEKTLEIIGKELAVLERKLEEMTRGT